MRPLLMLIVFFFSVTPGQGEEPDAKVNINKIYQPSQADMKKIREQRWEGYRKSRVDPYKKCGKTNKAWDADANLALEGYARYLENSSNVEFLEQAREHCAKAVAAKCTDPWVRYLQFRTSLVPKEEQAAFLLKVRQDMDKSSYPENLKLLVRLRSNSIEFHSSKQTEEDHERSKKVLGACLKDIVKIMESDTHDTCQVDTASHFQDLVADLFRLKLDPLEYYEELEGRLRDKSSHKKVLSYMKGKMHCMIAWDARGTGLAHTVSKEQFAKFNKHLKLAKEQLEGAWEEGNSGASKHLNATIATEMLHVLLGYDSDRDEMEKWFDRAMHANPDNTEACLKKMNFLLPKWHGSEEDAVEFGRACRDTTNHEAKLPLVLMRAHTEISNCLKPPANKEYLKKEQVRQETIDLLKDHLKVRPNNKVFRMELVHLALNVGDLDEAKVHIDIIGNTPSPMYDSKRYENDLKYFKEAEAYRKAHPEWRP